MSVAANQQRTFLRLLAQLRPHWNRDAALPARVQSLLAAHRGFGSRDRRLYRELIYTTLRHRPWIEPLLDRDPDEAVRRVAWLAADWAATRGFRATFATGEPPTGDRSELLPAWFRTHCPELFSTRELETQLRRAPLWLRFQTDAAGTRRVLTEFEERGWTWRQSEILAEAIELATEADVTKTHAWLEGAIEVQDLGSQLILASIGVERGREWLDACAGAGGKTLQLARLLGASGQVEAYDVRAGALEELRRRVTRAKQSVRVLAAPPTRTYAGVLVDAPCSGSGTWRRAPHLKWITTEAQIIQAATRQEALLDAFSRSVAPGGRLIYATCSLSRRENEDVVAAFLREHAEFETAPFANTFGGTVRDDGLTIMPSLHNTDGFFVASLRRAKGGGSEPVCPPTG
jgi:16S rRNA (cytosine967-C5)-methyltransferase